MFRTTTICRLFSLNSRHKPGQYTGSPTPGWLRWWHPAPSVECVVATFTDGWTFTCPYGIKNCWRTISGTLFQKFKTRTLLFFRLEDPRTYFAGTYIQRISCRGHLSHALAPPPPHKTLALRENFLGEMLNFTGNVVGAKCWKRAISLRACFCQIIPARKFGIISKVERKNSVLCVHELAKQTNKNMSQQHFLCVRKFWVLFALLNVKR